MRLLCFPQSAVARENQSRATPRDLQDMLQSCASGLRLEECWKESSEQRTVRRGVSREGAAIKRGGDETSTRIMKPMKTTREKKKKRKAQQGVTLFRLPDVATLPP